MTSDCCEHLRPQKRRPPEEEGADTTWNARHKMPAYDWPYLSEHRHTDVLFRSPSLANKREPLRFEQRMLDTTAQVADFRTRSTI